jgi:TonB-dependent SusC/RagA subfamily outer membrane receptor
MRKILFLFFIAFSSYLVAQTTTVKGLVTDQNSTPLPGATIFNQTEGTGVTTNFDGEFSIEINPESKLVISYIGYKDYILEGPFDELNTIQLISDSQLDEVVITALGIRREEKAIGYSVQGITGSEVAEVKSTNVINALSGKIAGVNITGSSAGPSASANITIRGATSLTGNNQPLFVVNGMPITNDLYSFDDGLNGSTSIDFGNAAQIINSDDIQNISVLKGPAASALYGSRAANGVILVETKTGDGVQKVSMLSSVQISN